MVLENVERIEVISGPGGSLWGANAVNGIINVVTKDAAATQGMFVEAGGGTFIRDFGTGRYGGRAGPDIAYRVFDHRLPIGARNSLMWGGGYRFMQDEVVNSPVLSFLPAVKDLHLLNGFIQNQLSLAEGRFKITLGTKLEHNDYSGFEWMPSGRIAWTPREGHRPRSGLSHPPPGKAFVLPGGLPEPVRRPADSRAGGLHPPTDNQRNGRAGHGPGRCQSSGIRRRARQPLESSQAGNPPIHHRENRRADMSSLPASNRRAAKGFGPVAVLLMVLFAGTLTLPAETVPGKEYQVKAVFLYNFAQFVEWPESVFTEDKSPLVVGVLGSDPFNAYLDEVVRGERVGSHPIQVVRYHRIEDIKNCHVLFVSASESSRLAPILAGLRKRKILTVGESDLFSRLGGMVSFVTRQGKIRLKINLEAVQAADLTVSSKLLRLAEIVTPRKG